MKHSYIWIITILLFLLAVPASHSQQEPEIAPDHVLHFILVRDMNPNTVHAFFSDSDTITNREAERYNALRRYILFLDYMQDNLLNTFNIEIHVSIIYMGGSESRAIRFSKAGTLQPRMVLNNWQPNELNDALTLLERNRCDDAIQTTTNNSVSNIICNSLSTDFSTSIQEIERSFGNPGSLEKRVVVYLNGFVTENTGSVREVRDATAENLRVTLDKIQARSAPQQALYNASFYSLVLSPAYWTDGSNSTQNAWREITGSGQLILIANIPENHQNSDVDPTHRPGQQTERRLVTHLFPSLTGIFSAEINPLLKPYTQNCTAQSDICLSIVELAGSRQILIQPLREQLQVIAMDTDQLELEWISTGQRLTSANAIKPDALEGKLHRWERTYPEHGTLTLERSGNAELNLVPIEQNDAEQGNSIYILQKSIAPPALQIGQPVTDSRPRFHQYERIGLTVAYQNLSSAYIRTLPTSSILKVRVKEQRGDNSVQVDEITLQPEQTGSSSQSTGRFTGEFIPLQPISHLLEMRWEFGSDNQYQPYIQAFEQPVVPRSLDFVLNCSASSPVQTASIIPAGTQSYDLLPTDEAYWALSIVSIAEDNTISQIPLPTNLPDHLAVNLTATWDINFSDPTLIRSSALQDINDWIPEPSTENASSLLYRQLVSDTLRNPDPGQVYTLRLGLELNTDANQQIQFHNNVDSCEFNETLLSAEAFQYRRDSNIERVRFSPGSNLLQQRFFNEFDPQRHRLSWTLRNLSADEEQVEVDQEPVVGGKLIDPQQIEFSFNFGFSLVEGQLYEIEYELIDYQENSRTSTPLSMARTEQFYATTQSP